MVGWKDLKYIILTLGLLIFLLVPFILKLKDHRLEMFPSVMMPSGANLIHKKDTIMFGVYEFYAKKNGLIEKLDLKEFMKPIPPWYTIHLAKSNFGLDSFSQEFKLYKPPIKFTSFNRFSASALIKTKKYYKEKLQNLGYDDSTFVFRTYRVKQINFKQYKILTSEKSYNLK